MPTTMPHASLGEALDVLQKQDRLIGSIPEVETVVGKLGRVGWRTVTEALPDARNGAIPPAVRPALPAFYDREGLLAVPHLGYVRPDLNAAWLPTLRFAPLHALAGARFHVTGVVL